MPGGDYDRRSDSRRDRYDTKRRSRSRSRSRSRDRSRHHKHSSHSRSSYDRRRSPDEDRSRRRRDSRSPDRDNRRNRRSRSRSPSKTRDNGRYRSEKERGQTAADNNNPERLAESVAAAAASAAAAAARAAARAAEEAAAAAAAAEAAPPDDEDDEEDPLDAFMSAEILPEVKQRQAEEAARKQEERARIQEALAAGKEVKPPKIAQDSDSEDEADLEMKIPTHKVKYVVGPSGTKIQEIEKKSKAKIQIKKDEAELLRGFGTGPNLKPVPKDGEERLTTVAIYGDSKAVEIAERMIQEAMDNKEQKAKQRNKEYEKKREEKRRNRQMYYLRHARDYEALEVPVGSSKIDVKKAYRRLAMLWHPDKHPDNQEEAKQKFQVIQRAYDSLMATNEEDTVQALAN